METLYPDILTVKGREAKMMGALLHPKNRRTLKAGWERMKRLEFIKAV